MTESRIVDGEPHVTHRMTAEQSRIYLALSPAQQEQWRRALDVALTQWQRRIMLESVTGGTTND